MKGIVSNLLQYGEWSIPDWLQLLSFSLHPVFADVEPHLVAHLELMVNLVFIMSSLITGLTFLQLLLHCLVNQLDSLNELLSFIPIITSTGAIFPSKDHQKGPLAGNQNMSRMVNAA